MPKGIDANTVLTNHAGCLAKSGIEFCGRYYKYSDTCLKRQEAEVLSKAGLWIVSIWESGYPTGPKYFSRSRGELDGTHSEGLAIDAGQTKCTPIYYTVDYDASPDDLPQIDEYFGAISENARDYAIGVYGSGLVCSHLKSLGLVSRTWLAAPLAWRGSEYSGWDIRQTGVNRSLCGVSVDLDESNGNAGGWKLEVA